MHFKEENNYIEEIESIESGTFFIKKDDIDAKFLVLSKPSHKSHIISIPNEISQIKILNIIPHVLFLLFLLMVLLILVKFFPLFINLARSLTLYKQKSQIPYFSQFFAAQSIFEVVIAFIY